MRSRGIWIGVVMLAACSGPSVEGDATVTLTDSWPTALVNTPIHSSAGSTYLASAVTDTNGTATIGVATDSAVSAYGATATWTLFGIDPGVAALLPIPGSNGQTVIEVEVVADPAADFGGITETSIRAGLGPACGEGAGTLGTRAVVDLPALCHQTDGRTTVTAFVMDPDDEVIGLGVQPDASNLTQVTVHELAEAPSAVVTHNIANVPEVGDATMSSAMYFVRKAQGFGWIWGYSGSVTQIEGDVPMYFPDLADGLFESVLFADDEVVRYAEIAVDSTTDVTLDAGAIPEPPLAVRVRNDDGLVVEIDDPGPTGYVTYFTVYWTGPDNVFHIWYAWAAPPDAAGTRTFRYPPLPPDLIPSAYLPPTNVELYAQASYTAADFAPADYRLGPEPWVPSRITTGARSYASRSAL